MASAPLQFRGAMTEEQNDGELLKYRRSRHHRIPESVQFFKPRCKHWMLHLRIQFPTEQYETKASKKTLLRDLQKYQKDQSFKYLNESTVPFISVGAGEGGMYTRWFCSLEELLWAMTHSCKASGNVLTIPRLYVGGCIPLSVRDGYMEMTSYSALQPDSELGFGSEEESVTYCRSSPSRWESSTRGTMTLSGE